ncbi:hypothetical protein ACWEPF_13755, partial [Kitasatospora sp. NPDC004289]
MEPRADFDEDFGLSGLAKFVQPWSSPRDAEGILAFTASLLEYEGSGYAAEVADDVRRLTGSALPDAVLSVLWLAATGARYDPDADGLGIRVWLNRLAGACLPYGRQAPPRPPRRPRPPPRPPPPPPPGAG